MHWISQIQWNIWVRSIGYHFPTGYHLCSSPLSQVESGTSTNMLDVVIEAMNLRGPVYLSHDEPYNLQLIYLRSFRNNSVLLKDDKFLNEKSWIFSFYTIILDLSISRQESEPKVMPAPWWLCHLEHSGASHGDVCLWLSFWMLMHDRYAFILTNVDPHLELCSA